MKCLVLLRNHENAHVSHTAKWYTKKHNLLEKINRAE